MQPGASLPLQETLYGGASAELLAVLQLQVELLRRSRKYVEAEGVVTRALGICGAAYGPNDVQVAVWKNQLAQVRGAVGDCGCHLWRNRHAWLQLRQLLVAGASASYTQASQLWLD